MITYVSLSLKDLLQLILGPYDKLETLFFKAFAKTGHIKIKARFECCFV